MDGLLCRRTIASFTGWTYVTVESFLSRMTFYNDVQEGEGKDLDLEIKPRAQLEAERITLVHLSLPVGRMFDDQQVPIGRTKT